MTASALDFKHGDEKWQALRARCLRDLYWFAEVVLGYGPFIPMTPGPHRLLCKFLERKTGQPLLDNRWYRKIEMPRETGKSTLLRAYAVQRICQNPDIAILLVNEKEQLAKDFLGDIKWHFQSNDLFRALFSDIVPPEFRETTWSATRIVVNRSTGRPDPTIDVIGVGGAVTGKHPDLILVDDMISREAMENARAGSWQIMHQTNRWINQLDPLLNKNALPCPEITWVGTRWWHGDSYEHVEKAYGGDNPMQTCLLRTQLPNGVTQQVPAYAKGNLAIFRRAAIEDGRSIFPEKWSLDKLAEIRVRDPELFAANYLNAPADEITATFKQDWLKFFAWLDDDQIYITDQSGKKTVRALRDLDKIVIVDPGGFQEKTTDDRARAAAWMLGDDLQGNYFGLDCYAEKDTYLAAIRHIVMWAQKYGPRKIYVERAGQQAAFAQLLRQELEKAACLVPVDDTTLKPEGRAKELRILEMEPYFQRGQVYVGTGAQFHEFRTQYSQFPRAQRLDVIDALGYWPRLMRKHHGTHQKPEERQQKELATYRLRRNWRTA